MDRSALNFYSPTEAHLWPLSCLPEDFGALSEEERNQSTRIEDKGEKYTYVASRAGLRRLIRGYNPEARVHLRHARGKPYVEGGPEFNMSHSRGQVFVIVSPSEIGFDIEAADRKPPSRELQQRYFTAMERDAISHSLRPDLAALRLWVCKEAMVKLSGDGIAYGFKGAEVEAGQESITAGSLDGREVFISELHPAPGLTAAVASWVRLDVKCFFPS